MTILTGACLCGKVRYSVKEQPKFSIQCYCTDCQKISGGGSLPQMGVERSTTDISGDLKVYEFTSPEGRQVKSAFCPDCGAPIFKATSRFPDILFLTAGSLDDPSKFKPDQKVWEQSKADWDT